MNYTFHLTEKCNLDCTYCYEGEKGTGELSLDEIKVVLDREAKSGSERCQITFFGGEPLLKKELIYEVVDYAKQLEKENDIKFTYSITTNGTLIDREFIKVAKKNDFLVGLSLDGREEVHNRNRKTYSGEGTFDVVSEHVREVLKQVKKVVAMPVVTKNNYREMRESAEYLFHVGFQYVNMAFDYTAPWVDEDISILRREYERLAELYYEKTKNNNEFYLLPFEDKINTHIKQTNCEEKCLIAVKHVNVGCDGKFYPCMQFVGKPEYVIGDIEKGIDEDKKFQLQKYIFENGVEICENCKIRKRCRHSCGCLNIITTGDVAKTSPLICETERMLVEVSDKLAERLYKEGFRAFYTKKYFWGL